MITHLATAIALAAAAISPAPAATSLRPDLYMHSSHDGWCISSNIRVASSEDAPRSWSVAVEYCQPLRWAHGPRRVDVLTHGATYTRTYWDWPEGNGAYSYVGRALDDGRATLNYDRIGNGDSTRPASSTEITMATDAYVLHQLVTILKWFGYQKIASVSHSYGSGVALAEAAEYGDVSTVVVSGYLHRPSNPAVTAGNYPANQDPKFAAAGLDDGWLTSRPGVRGTSFHSPSADPDVVAQDEAQKDLVSRTGLLNFLSQRGVPPADNISTLVEVPVLVLQADQDAIFCHDPATFNCSDQGAVTANEAPFYANAREFWVSIVPGSGHSLTLHPTAGLSYWTIKWWVTRN